MVVIVVYQLCRILLTTKSIGLRPGVSSHGAQIFSIFGGAALVLVNVSFQSECFTNVLQPFFEWEGTLTSKVSE